MIYDSIGKVVLCDTAVNAKMFGAKGDGINDDSDFLNHLFNNYKNIYLPEGMYKISKTLVIPEGVKICGDGENSVIKLSDTHTLTGYEWRNSYKYPYLYVSGNNCILKDFCVHGDETAARDLGHVGILISGDGTLCHNIRLKNINYFPNEWIGGTQGYGTVNAPGYGFAIFRCKQVVIDSCRSDGNGYEGIGTENAENVIIKNCFVGDGNRTGIQVHRHCKDIIIANCIVKNTNEHKHSDFTIHGDAEPCTGIKIIGCSFLIPIEEKASIHTVSGLESDVIIESCYINSQNRAISIGHDWASKALSRNVIIANNVINAETDGILANGDNVVVTGNIIKYSGTPIYISGEHTVISNNLNLLSS